MAYRVSGRAVVACAGIWMLASALDTTDPRYLVLPPPAMMHAKSATTMYHLAAGFAVKIHDSTAAAAAAAGGRLERTTSRYSALLAPLISRTVAEQGSHELTHVELIVASGDGAEGLPSLVTDYSYELSLTSRGAGATIRARSVHGAAYALESFAQLFTGRGGRTASVHLPTQLMIMDAPALPWRGIMLDAGRRFFPVPLVENFLDTMAAIKLNVLHWHLSDECRWAVESKVFPNLTNGLTGELGGFYTQADVAGVVAYASDRGIRVVPEFDVPGHTHGMVPISESLAFCYPAEASRSQLYGDPGDVTFNALTALFAEMAALFPDASFHIGCDETSPEGPCTVDSTFALERRLMQYIEGTLKKTPAAWEEALFDAGAATNDTVVYAWSRETPAQIIALGRRAVNSDDAAWYFTDPAPGGPAGWSTCWHDPALGVPAANLAGLLGAEASLWSDTYCYSAQCGASGGSTPVGAKLFPPSRDAEFGKSAGGMTWPRGYVAAAAFYNYNASVKPDDPAFVSAIWALNDALAARGSLVCPTNCSCDQLSACGVPYISAPVPSVGDGASTSVCILPVAPSQGWVVPPAPGGQIALAANQSLCLQEPQGGGVYPLTLGLCADGGTTGWVHDTKSATIVSQASRLCMDRRSDGVIGTYECGSGSGLRQPNQEFSADEDTGMLVSLFDASCVTAG